MWSLETSRGNEAEKVRNRIAIYLNGQGLDLGCGPWKISVNESVTNNCIGVDQSNKADVVRKLSDLSIFKDEHFDFVFSSHALEDFYYSEAALAEWWAKLKPGGFFILYLPLTRKVAKAMGREDWEKFYPNMGEEGANPAHKQDLHPEEIKAIISRIGKAMIVDEEIRVDGMEYSFLQVYMKLSSSAVKVKGLSKSNGKTACVVRYGAIGDLIQCSPVFRLLKEQGYHVTVNCSDYGVDVLKNNPYIDRLAVQRRDLVPGKDLKEYWDDMAKGFDLFVNLTGCVEDSLLIPDARFFIASEELQKKAPQESDLAIFEAVVKDFRKRVGDSNYYDAHLEKAGLPQRGLNGELYFSDAEEIPAKDFRMRHKNKFLIMWSLAGSSYHKWYPWFHKVVEDVLVKIPESLVISVGDEACQLMERSESMRYIPRAGRWKLRQSLVMTKYVDLVIGCETGILNAAGCFPTPKITLLSHSKHENLCKYWKNDYCLAPENTFCHPCHMLHYVHPQGKECPNCGTTHMQKEGNAMYGEGLWSCPYENIHQDENGDGFPFPICMSQGISPERVLNRILEVHKAWKEARMFAEVT